MDEPCIGNKLNAPTTGEIVRELRAHCNDTPYTIKYYDVVDYAIDRLESQEREIEQLKKANQFGGEMIDKQERDIERLQGEMFANALESAERIATLTARAEQAERERNALVKIVDRLVEAWENFKRPELIEIVKQWRGLPQDGGAE